MKNMLESFKKDHQVGVLLKDLQLRLIGPEKVPPRVGPLACSDITSFYLSRAGMCCNKN